MLKKEIVSKTCQMIGISKQSRLCSVHVQFCILWKPNQTICLLCFFWQIFARITVPLLALMTERCCCLGQKYMADSVFFFLLLCHICLFLPVMKWAVILAQTDRSDPFSFSISISSPLTSCPADVFITDILVWWWDRQKIGGRGRGGRGRRVI